MGKHLHYVDRLDRDIFAGTLPDGRYVELIAKPGLRIVIGSDGEFEVVTKDELELVGKINLGLNEECADSNEFLSRDKDILEKAIQKAINNGWSEILTTEAWSVARDLHIDIQMRSVYTGNEISSGYAYQEFIFNRDFAKALWGDKPMGGIPSFTIKYGVDYHGRLPAWQYHLQQMVIAEDPIKYLGENLNDA